MADYPRPVPNYVEAFLFHINRHLTRMAGNAGRRDHYDDGEFHGVFCGSDIFDNGVFKVAPDEEREEREWIFTWKDVSITWYKRLGRGMSMTRELSPAEAVEMLNDCMGSLFWQDYGDRDPSGLTEFAMLERKRIGPPMAGRVKPFGESWSPR